MSVSLSLLSELCSGQNSGSTVVVKAMFGITHSMHRILGALWLDGKGRIHFAANKNEGSV